MSVEFVTCFLKLFSCHGSDCVRVVRTELAWEEVWSRFLVRHIYILHIYYKSVKELGGKFFNWLKMICCKACLVIATL